MSPTEAAEALDAPVKAEVRSGLDAANLLPVGHGSLQVTAGVNNAFAGGLGAFVRAEADWHPTQSLTGYAYAEANLAGVTAGLGARLTF